MEIKDNFGVLVTGFANQTQADEWLTAYIESVYMDMQTYSDKSNIHFPSVMQKWDSPNETIILSNGDSCNIRKLILRQDVFLEYDENEYNEYREIAIEIITISKLNDELKLRKAIDKHMPHLAYTEIKELLGYLQEPRKDENSLIQLLIEEYLHPDSHF